jgi:excinuclease UvrABC nuclease subunit
MHLMAIYKSENFNARNETFNYINKTYSMLSNVEQAMQQLQVLRDESHKWTIRSHITKTLKIIQS